MTAAALAIPTVDPDDFRPDPHAGFRRHRERSPLIQFEGGLLYATRYADVAALLTDPRTRQPETEALDLRGITSGALYDFFANVMLLSNAPAHMRRRAPVARTFAFKLMDALRPRIRAFAHDLIEAAKPTGDMEFRDAFASQIPARMIAEVLGVPAEETPRFTRCVYAMSRGLGAFRDEDFAHIEAAAAELYDFVRAQLADRRACPREDFLTEYLSAVEEAGELSEVETYIQIVALILAGSDTTRTAMTAMLGFLLEDRSQWDALREDPSLAAGAAAEALRMEPPVGAIPRFPLETVEVGGHAVKEGSFLVLSVLSALRDPAQFADPDRFDIRRGDHPRWHLAFGAGPHRCLGEALARAELEESARALAEALPDLRMEGVRPRVKGHSGIRAVDPLRVAWR